MARESDEESDDSGFLYKDNPFRSDTPDKVLVPEMSIDMGGGRVKTIPEATYGDAEEYAESKCIDLWEKAFAAREHWEEAREMAELAKMEMQRLAYEYELEHRQAKMISENSVLDQEELDEATDPGWFYSRSYMSMPVGMPKSMLAYVFRVSERTITSWIDKHPENMDRNVLRIKATDVADSLIESLMESREDDDSE